MNAPTATAPVGDGPRTERRRFLAALLLGLGLLAAGAAACWPFFCDDAFISLRYAERFLDGKGLTWNDGERVEGYSNLAWGPANAALGAMGVDLVLAARTLGIACTVAALVLLAWRARRSGPASLAATALAAAAPVPVWAIGGLESPLLLLAVTAGWLECERALADPVRRGPLLRAGAWFALGCLCRPDAPLFPAFAALAIAVQAVGDRAGRTALRRLGLLLVLPALAVLGQLAFRLAYYGDHLPNTARVKLGLGEAGWIAGVAYLRTAWPVFLPLLLPAVLAAGLPRLPRGQRVLALAGLATVAAWAVYVLEVGGDFFPAWRFLSPLVPVLVLLSIVACERLDQGSRGVRLAAWALAIAAVLGLRVQAMRDHYTRAAAEEVWEWDFKAIGETLAGGFGAQQPLVALDAAGSIPYHSRLPTIDMLGLNDAAIARDMARGDASSAFSAAHRRGSPDYLFGRAPDLFFFDKPVPDDPGGLQIVDDARFHADYRGFWLRVADRAVNREVPGELLVPFWARVRGRVGVVTDPQRVAVPAWLFGSYAHPPGFRRQEPVDPRDRAVWSERVAAAAAWLGGRAVARIVDGAMVFEVRAPGRYAFDALELPVGTWALRVDPDLAGCRLLAPTGNGGWQPIEATWQVTAAGRHALALEVAPTAPLPVRIRQVELSRQ